MLVCNFVRGFSHFKVNSTEQGVLGFCHIQVLTIFGKSLLLFFDFRGKITYIVRFLHLIGPELLGNYLNSFQKCICKHFFHHSASFFITLVRKSKSNRLLLGCFIFGGVQVDFFRDEWLDDFIFAFI